MFIQNANNRTSRARPAITLIETPHRKSMFEKEMRYDVHLHGQPWGDLYFNLSGYRGYLPTVDGPLDIGERPIGTYRQHIRTLNRQWAETNSQKVPSSPMALAGASNDTNRIGKPSD